ncbi:MAG: AAA family ATPase, partial [Myxococcales bacterium]|nr:AAA family ATPase [Myxococcales bacterium]
MARTPQALIPETTLVEGRFRVLRALGQGGMGAVYEAFDEQRGQTVALKTLSRCDPQSLYRLKHEFRALSDVAHPNLVALHEFFCDPNAWFFTMDLLRGRDFCSFVREMGDLELGQTRRANERTFDEPRLRSALSQLIQGVCALHEAGKLHCDIKPANVIVGDDGHLRILDFGLVSDAGEESAGQTLGPEWAGTPGYMAPEQMLAQETTAASDFYAVGVMLYEAMNGCLPFKRSTSIGPPAGMRREVHMPHHLATGTTADLAQLCIELLAFEAEARPSRRRLLEYAGDAVRASAPSMPEHAPANPFVGRSNELDQLLSLRLRLEPAKPEAVLIRGPSGIGKTRLAREFLAVCRKDGDSVVLEGRCYERESLPYNAFDSLIDALSRYLRKLPAVRAASVMPRDARLLADLFPVLERVEVIQASPPLSRARASAAREPLEHRRRAFEALRELLSRISDAATLVLCIDDLQWADADSMQLLQALVAAPDAPTMLVLGLYREDDEQPPAQIEQLCERQGVPLSDIRLLPLSAPAVRELVAERLDDANADRIVAESGGNPFFIGELVAAAADQGQDRVRGLHEVILQRADGLSKDMRKLLDILSVAGQPIELGIALQAADLEAGGQAVITEMRNERWLRLDPTGTT